MFTIEGRLHYKPILFCRLPGLLSLAARRARCASHAQCPLIASEGRLVRDACPLALGQGVRPGMTVVQARRLCPTLIAVLVEQINAIAQRQAFLDVLADLSPMVEPTAMDAAYVDLTSCPEMNVVDHILQRLTATFGLAPVLGVGISRLAAQACAECGVDDLRRASVDFLWHDDPAVPARMKRLGLNVFGDVAETPLEALRLHFGRIAPILLRRAHGQDLTPIRALYPPPFVDVMIDCSEFPVEDKILLDHVITKASTRAARQLQSLGAGRKLILEVRTESGQLRQEWAVPLPLMNADEIQRAARRLLGQMRLPVPVIGVRILIEEVGVPNAHTADLFGVQSDNVTLDAVKRRLASRFGLTTVQILGQMPRSARAKRREAVEERDAGFQRRVGQT